jgi:type IV secretory pathway VirB10-like protein
MGVLGARDPAPRLNMNKLSIATTTLAIALLTQAAAATEYCVRCSGPDATYRCEVSGIAGGNNSDPRLQLLCISELAKTGSHDTCSVDRKATDPNAGLTCEGELRVIAAPSSPPPGAPPAATATDAPAMPAHPIPAAEAPQPLDPAQAETPAEPSPDKVPQTMEELAGQTMKNSKENLKKAGDAIGGTGEAIAGGAKKAGETIGEAGSSVGTAAKKTWTCLTSLFNDC